MSGWGIFLKDYDYERMSEWMAKQHSFVLKSIVAYLPFNLERPLTVWNWFLAIFSLWGVMSMLPALFRVISKHGLSYTYTHRSELETGLYGRLRALPLGLLEDSPFVDTAFIVLRKRPLITMHWWHHVASAYTSFVCFSSGDAFLVWCSIIK
ncbi:Elongation of very long chain fatty acids protein [Aphelenchoides fujianensis]|nr:Elongation of very long chain fatty acids protein [Aphelenchoides fujianensis]